MSSPDPVLWLAARQAVDAWIPAYPEMSFRAGELEVFGELSKAMATLREALR